MAPARAASGANLQIVRAPGWTQSWLIHGFSTRLGGITRVYRPDSEQSDLNLGFTASDKADNVSRNRALFIDSVAQNQKVLGLVTLKQIHSALIWRVGVSDVEQNTPHNGDGLMTDTPGVLIGIQTADCIPILVADRKKRAVAAFHAGWRGTVARIVESGIGRMRLEFGSRPQDLTASIGPGIGGCCYAIGEEVRDQFESQFSYAPALFREVENHEAHKEKYPLQFLTGKAPGHGDPMVALHLDLPEANRRQLLAAGLKESAIHMTGECTGCQTARYFSHRLEKGFTGRMMSVIGIANS